jgi:hypothetical protein
VNLVDGFDGDEGASFGHDEVVFYIWLRSGGFVLNLQVIEHQAKRRAVLSTKHSKMTTIQREDCRDQLAVRQLNKCGVSKINVLVAITVKNCLNRAEVVEVKREQNELLGEQCLKKDDSDQLDARAEYMPLRRLPANTYKPFQLAIARPFLCTGRAKDLSYCTRR